MTVSVLAPNPLHDGMPACPDWCQAHTDTPAFDFGGVQVGPARRHYGQILTGAIRVFVDRSDERGVKSDPNPDVMLAIGDVEIRLTPDRLRDLRAALDRAAPIAGAA